MSGIKNLPFQLPTVKRTVLICAFEDWEKDVSITYGKANDIIECFTAEVYNVSITYGKANEAFHGNNATYEMFQLPTVKRTILTT